MNKQTVYKETDKPSFYQLETILTPTKSVKTDLEKLESVYVLTDQELEDEKEKTSVEFVKWMNTPMKRYGINGKSILRCSPQASDYNTCLLYEDRGKGMVINSETKFYTVEELYQIFLNQQINKQP